MKYHVGPSLHSRSLSTSCKCRIRSLFCVFRIKFGRKLVRNIAVDENTEHGWKFTCFFWTGAQRWWNDGLTRIQSTYLRSLRVFCSMTTAVFVSSYLRSFLFWAMSPVKWSLSVLLNGTKANRQVYVQNIGATAVFYLHHEISLPSYRLAISLLLWNWTFELVYI